MARPGTVIENPITGERITFLRTAAETAGELLQLDLVVRPRGFVAAAHEHPEQEERFVVHAGLLRLRVGAEEHLLGPGSEAVVPAGVPHAWANAAPSHLHATVEFRPALRMASMLETLFGLAAAGRTNAKGVPNRWRLAGLARAYRREFRLTGPRGVLLGFLGLIGRLLGSRSGLPTTLARPAAAPDSSEGTADRPEPSLPSEPPDSWHAPTAAADSPRTWKPWKAARSRP
jgi:quercetin dioxygenase-like cupin family protein